MCVCIVQGRDREPPAKVDHVGVGAAQILDLGAGPDGKHVLTGDGERLDEALFLATPNATPDQNTICCLSHGRVYNRSVSPLGLRPRRTGHANFLQASSIKFDASNLDGATISFFCSTSERDVDTRGVSDRFRVGEAWEVAATALLRTV